MKKFLLTFTFTLSIFISFSQSFTERNHEIQPAIEAINSSLTSYENVIVENEELLEQMTDGEVN